MSYKPLPWVEGMLTERWGRMVEDPSHKAPPTWMTNNHPRELAAEYLTLVTWAQQMEQELERATDLLAEIGDRLHGVPELVPPQLVKSRAALEAKPRGDKASAAAS